ncbi:MAG TPA: hypothetical protein VG986_02635 [Pseudolabrys sp.]|nr:hypothetical protein [Pseudolabrys sp.]
MKYQDCTGPAQAGDARREAARAPAPYLSDANINPETGLATDYLNHFNEAIMLLDMATSCPDCRAEFLDWQPMGYREHFAASRFAGRELAIAAYETADPALRERLDRLASTMTALLEAMRALMLSEWASDAKDTLTASAVVELKSLVTRAGALINGAADCEIPPAPQAVVDRLLKR